MGSISSKETFVAVFVAVCTVLIVIEILGNIVSVFF